MLCIICNRFNNKEKKTYIYTYIVKRKKGLSYEVRNKLPSSSEVV